MRNRQIDQRNKIESQEIEPKIYENADYKEKDNAYATGYDELLNNYHAYGCPPINFMKHFFLQLIGKGLVT